MGAMKQQTQLSFCFFGTPLHIKRTKEKIMMTGKRIQEETQAFFMS